MSGLIHVDVEMSEETNRKCLSKVQSFRKPYKQHNIQHFLGKQTSQESFRETKDTFKLLRINLI